WYRRDFRNELVDIQSSAYQLLCEDGGISEARRGITIDEYEASEGVGEIACGVVCGVCVFETGK
ncbi:hypothetical protein A2U01_0066587, partial [Trifolium medium]|nr:hypothetical protein [Trifolium medium]